MFVCLYVRIKSREVIRKNEIDSHLIATENVRVTKIVNEADKNGVYKVNVEIKHSNI